MLNNAKIFIADQRQEASIGEGWIRSTFNYGTFQDPDKQPFGALRHLNEWGGASGQVFQFVNPAGTTTVLLPTVGGITVVVAGEKIPVNLGQLFVLRLPNLCALRLPGSPRKAKAFVSFT